MHQFMSRMVVLGLACGLVWATSRAHAGFQGDGISVSLTVHTTGAIDQVVWSNTPAVVVQNVILGGDSWPANVNGIMLWSLEGVGPDPTCFVLSAFNTSDTTTTIEPMLFTITGLDAMPIGGVTLGLNSMGVLPGDVSFTANSITISSALLTPLAPYEIRSVEICIVPEVSSVTMLALVASAAGGLLWSRRRGVR